MTKTVQYSEVRDTLGTGDIILFSGRGAGSAIIKWFTRSRWSHVGMVLRDLEWDMVLLWESTTLSKTKDIRTNKPRRGVQIVPLSNRIEQYDGDIALKRLINFKLGEYQMNTLRQFRQEVKFRPYEEDKLELFKSAYDWFGGRNEEDLSSLFCSELVAELFQRWDLLHPNLPSNEYTPKDFAQMSNLRHGAILSPLTYLT